MSDKQPTGGPAFWVGTVIGLGVMAFGLRGLLLAADATQPAQFAKWFIGGDILHDLLIAPAVVVVGVLLARVMPRPWRPPVRAGLIATALVITVGWAPLRGYGRATVPDNPTVQPLDYSTAVTTAVAIVWLFVAAWLVTIAWRRASRRRSPRATPPNRRARDADHLA